MYNPQDTFSTTDDKPMVVIDGVVTSIDSLQVELKARTLKGKEDIKLIQFSTLREKGPRGTPSSIEITGLITNDEQDPEADQVKFERIQFERSTNHNGRRSPQEEFELLLTLHGISTDNKTKIPICSSTSIPIVVRGRSPGHYPEDPVDLIDGERL